jgi:hypothetical protein
MFVNSRSCSRQIPVMMVQRKRLLASSSALSGRRPHSVLFDGWRHAFSRGEAHDCRRWPPDAASSSSVDEPLHKSIRDYAANRRTCGRHSAAFRTRSYGILANTVAAAIDQHGAAQAPRLRVPLAGARLVAMPEVPPDSLVPNIFAPSEVLGTPTRAQRASVSGFVP